MYNSSTPPDGVSSAEAAPLTAADGHQREAEIRRRKLVAVTYLHPDQ